ncbi:paREP2b [Pyrobaculum aerophilum str. IM2]|uniref:PaRep2b protein n=1 Tax=Pyrobaculum aerophilum TaxID=13773 RepID=A0A832T379_9CREN|nr:MULTISPECIES: PaRep2b protein [Pyrobaculum]AAL63640.1 paREP2b [Pyrobaculum aerophilum str. IM2]MCX8137840.1 PaRep2b protein [Pyrobaculum aerophilum]HII46834.1 PaRep2b protein [Pyrobaculum aerophilum]
MASVGDLFKGQRRGGGNRVESADGEGEEVQVDLLADELNALRRFKALKDAIDKWRG